MEQLITTLEAKITSLIEQLDMAHKTIKQLQGETSPTIERSASIDLLQQIAGRSTEDQLQLYIEDSLDLLENDLPSEQAIPSNHVDLQLGFDVLHELADHSTTTTTTEQIDYMTTQQPELNGLQKDDILVDTENTSVHEASESTREAAILTPEQKKRQKNQKNNRRLIKLLEDRYPKAFDWNQPKPLKVGIDKDMALDDDFNASKQKRALAAYTRSDRYKKCLLSGQPRIDLEGTAVNNEPALPDSMIPKKAKTTTTGRPMRDRTSSPSPKAKNKARFNADKNKAKIEPKVAKEATLKQDDVYDNLSAEDRMKAKLEKLLNK